MSQLSESELRTKWRERWDGLLTQVRSAEDPEGVQNVLRDKRTIGNAERKIAGGHEGREILELLQNARDAIWDGDDETGRVHVGVYDEGVLVANTGSGFDLFDPEVEDAVTMIGETGKGDDDDESIGHLGVGLKSILATGDSFEIFTRPDEQSDDILGVRLSRAYLVSALLARLGHENQIPELIGDIADENLRTLLQEGETGDGIRMTESLAETIAKLPLFNFPVPLQTDGNTSDRIRTRVRELLTSEGEADQTKAYRTSVFIRYQDDAWRSQLDSIGASPPDENQSAVEDRPENIWDYLAQSQGDGGLQPETIVQLGGISELHLERVTAGHPATTTSERWQITRSTSPNVTFSDLQHTEVTVQITEPEGSDRQFLFDQFRFAAARTHHTAVLVNKPGDETDPPFESYPLYLFYPIEGTSKADLPFCLHGRFRVETNRKDLSANSTETNQQVLAEAVDLIELVSREVAASVNSPAAPTYSSNLPWALLPPVPDIPADLEPSATAELIPWFQQEIYDRLSDTAAIATSEKPHLPQETLLHWDEDVLRGYLGFYSLLATLERDLSTEAEQTMPSQDLLKNALRTPAGWDTRLKALLTVEDEVETSNAVLTGWAQVLDTSLSRAEDGPVEVSVPGAAARSVLTGTVRLFVSATGPDEAVKDKLTELGDVLDGVFLLPCGTGEELALVPLERRQTPAGGRHRRRQLRSVIWDIESASRDVDRPPSPPQKANMTVYFLDEHVQEVSDVHHVLNQAGRVWGIRAYEGIPSFVRSLLDTFADGHHNEIGPIDFAFLAAIVDRLGEESSDLQTGEGSFLPLDYLHSAIPQQEGERRANLRRRVQLRDAQLKLAGEQSRRIRDGVLGDGWQQLRETAERSEEDEDDTVATWNTIEADGYPAPTWPEPKAKTWNVFKKAINREITDYEFVRTLALLGASTIPGIRVVWMYGDDHPDMRQDHHWNPVEWTTEDFSGEIPESITHLQQTLTESSGYLDEITRNEFHPQRSANHSQKCPVNVDGTIEQVNVASWVWVDSPDQLASYGHAIREVLRRHGESLRSTVLRSGWSCNNGHKRRSWTNSVPSLLNWQLRSLSIWEPLVDVGDHLEDQWGEETTRLQYAVRQQSSRGAQAARMFPSVDEETEFSNDFLDTLGVKPVDELALSGATERLQKLQEVLVDGSLPEEGTKQLWIPTERINDWNQAYTQLLQPVLKQLGDEDKPTDIIDQSGLLHLPIRDGDTWQTAPIAWIQANAEEFRYYQDQSPKPWEVQEVADSGLYILPRPARGPFTRLTDFLGIEQLEASKLVLDLDAEELQPVTEDYQQQIVSFKRELRERRDLLVASTERSDEDEIVDTADTLSMAISNIEVVERFPETALNQLSDPASALYATEEGHEGLLLNAAESPAGLSLSGFAMGLALLVESPTKVATFREALRKDIDVETLETRWAKRTFPIAAVKRILGSNALQHVEAGLNALEDLLHRLDIQSPESDRVNQLIDDKNPTIARLVLEWLGSGTSPDELRDELGDADTRELASLIDEIRESLPDELRFIMPGLFAGDSTNWVHQLEVQDVDPATDEHVIRWLQANREIFEQPPFDTGEREAYSRFTTVTELWAQTDPDELTDYDTWAHRLRQFHSTEVPAWTDRLRRDDEALIDAPPIVAHISIDNRVGHLTETFCEEVEAALPALSFDVRAIITEYVENGHIPELETDRGAKDHQERAFSDIATHIETTGEVKWDWEDAIPTEGEAWGQEPSMTASTGGGSSGGSSQFRGRGQQAEAYVMAGVLDRVRDWLKHTSGGDFLQFRSKFKKLHSQQQDQECTWHVETVWESDLLPLLNDSRAMEASTVTEWRSRVSEGTPFTELPLIRLINVTMERGPGFDVIDPLGPLTSDEGKDAYGLRFAPVEVKAVGGKTQPFSFRLTTNEYRQARAFISDGDIPYIIRLVDVPEPGTQDWAARTEVVLEKRLETEADLEQIIGSQHFEQVVKGGYMNMQIE